MFSNRLNRLSVDCKAEQNSLLVIVCSIMASRLDDWRAMHHLRLEVQQERRALRTLPDHLLHDIGITRADADHESARKNSDLPADRMVSCGD